MKFSDRPPVRAGADEVWDRAEAALREACTSAGVEYDAEPGRGRLLRPEAGIRAARRDRPRLAVRHAPGRFRACRTGWAPNTWPRTAAAARPVMLHRAILGSFERFLGVLIEHYAGRFPLWLAPVQAVVATIVSDADDYAREVAAALRTAGLQVELDLPNQKINAKVRGPQRWRMCRCWRWSGGGRRRSGTRGAAPAGRARRRRCCRWTRRCGCLRRRRRHPICGREAEVTGPGSRPDRLAALRSSSSLDPQRIYRPNWLPAIVNHDRRRP